MTWPWNFEAIADHVDELMLEAEHEGDPCSVCEGTGWRMGHLLERVGEHEWRYVVCGTCRGTGNVGKPK